MADKYYGYYKSPIGILEIVTSEDSLLSVTFTAEQKQTDINIAILDRAIQQLDEYFQGKRKDFDLKLYLDGTDFQKKVWQQLKNIPFGKTISYKELAAKIGNDKASRAVGGANNKNKIAIVVPCHRVIGANKELTGYAGGLDKKKWLLEHEGI